MDEFDFEELAEYIRTAMRVAKREGFDEDRFFAQVLQSLISKYLDLDTSMERVRQVAIDSGIIEDEE